MPRGPRASSATGSVHDVRPGPGPRDHAGSCDLRPAPAPGAVRGRRPPARRGTGRPRGGLHRQRPPLHPRAPPRWPCSTACSRGVPGQSALEVATATCPRTQQLSAATGSTSSRCPAAASPWSSATSSGHGIHAAATMGRLRTAVQTFADLDLEPRRTPRQARRTGRAAGSRAGTLGRRRDRPQRDLPVRGLRPGIAPLHHGRAGHPPPAVVTPDGTAGISSTCPPALRSAWAACPSRRPSSSCPRQPARALHRRADRIAPADRDIDTGLNTMRKSPERRSPPAQRPSPDAAPRWTAVCDRLVDALLPEPARDDTALLVARTRPCPPTGSSPGTCPPTRQSSPTPAPVNARQLAAWGLEEITFTTELILSELVTNAIRHAQPPSAPDDPGQRAELRGLRRQQHRPAPAPRRRYDEGGRGLMLVAQLAERWGTRYTAPGRSSGPSSRCPAQRVNLPSKAFLGPAGPLTDSGDAG